MVTDPGEYLRSVISPLCEPLHETFEWSADQAHQRRGKALQHHRYDWLGTHITRALAHHRLTTVADLAGWKVTGNHRRNGELWLTRGLTTVRLLHTNSTLEVPVAGHNAARKAYYRNPPLFDLPVQTALDLADASRLLALWRVVNPETFEVAFRVVRTLDEGEIGNRSEIDVDFMLPRSAEEMEQLEWFPSDEDMDITLPGEEEQGDTGDADGLLG